MQEIFSRTGLVCAAAFLAVSASSVPAPAAVRRCHAVVSSEIVTAPNELDAKKQALEQWRVKAQGLGSGFDSWRLAHEKSLKCFKTDAGFECVAFAAPCIVDQTPNSPLPPASQLPGQTPGKKPGGKDPGT